MRQCGTMPHLIILSRLPGSSIKSQQYFYFPFRAELSCLMEGPGVIMTLCRHQEQYVSLGGLSEHKGGGKIWTIQVEDLSCWHRKWLTAEGQFDSPSPHYSSVPVGDMSLSTSRYAAAKMTTVVCIRLSALIMFGTARWSIVARGGLEWPLLSNAASRWRAMPRPCVRKCAAEGYPVCDEWLH